MLVQSWFTLYKPHHCKGRVPFPSIIYTTLDNTRVKLYSCRSLASIANGVATRVHGNTGKTKKRFGLTLKEIQDVVQYIMNYAGVCTRERERERERQSGRKRDTEIKSRERNMEERERK